MGKRAKIIAVVGAGGKTTRIHQLAKQFLQEGKRVFVTTTTHMWQDADTDLSGELSEYVKKIKQTNYCMAGIPTSDGKIKALPETLFQQMEQEVDVILVEADGSKGLPVKMPSEAEPVIPKDCDEIHIVMGLNALGQTFKQAAHRLPIIMKQLGVAQEDIIWPWHIQKMIEIGYLTPLRQNYPQTCIKVCPAQMHTEYEKKIGECLEKEQDVTELLPKIDLILLAAGSSSRFGTENKLLQKVNEKPLFSYTVELAKKICQKNKGIVDHIVVVSGYEEVCSYVESDSHIIFVYHDHPELGISESIKMGVAKTDARHSLLFMVCDQPKLTEETVEGLIQEYTRQSAKAGCVRRSDGTQGNPCIFHPDLRESLLLLTGDCGGKKILKQISEAQKCYYEAREECELTDIDTKEDLHSIRSGCY